LGHFLKSQNADYQCKFIFYAPKQAIFLFSESWAFVSDINKKAHNRHSRPENKTSAAIVRPGSLRQSLLSFSAKFPAPEKTRNSLKGNPLIIKTNLRRNIFSPNQNTQKPLQTKQSNNTPAINIPLPNPAARSAAGPICYSPQQQRRAIFFPAEPLEKSGLFFGTFFWPPKRKYTRAGPDHTSLRFTKPAKCEIPRKQQIDFHYQPAQK